MDSLLTDIQCGRVEVVLVSPRNPLNIGAAARAMANFGFRRLAVVSPFEAHWREAKSAVGAPDVLGNARETGSLAEAAADCTLVVGTATLDRRKAEQPVVPLPELGPRVAAALERGGRVALVFGSEKRGLTREYLAYCHLLAVIPTDTRQPSMNLGQAVAVCLYELAGRTNVLEGAQDPVVSHPSGKNKSLARMGHPMSAGLDDFDHDAKPATTRDLGLLAGVVEETMAAVNYSPAAMKKANRHDVRLLLRRLALNRRDAARILGLFRRILWKLKDGSNRECRSPRDLTRK